MREFQEKRRLRKILSSRAVLAALFVLFAFISLSTAKVYLKSRLAVSKNEQVKREIEEMEKRKADMEKEIKRLKSDFGMEEEIRERFNVQKPDEKVLIIVDKTGKIDFNERKPEGFWTGIWRKIKGVF